MQLNRKRAFESPSIPDRLYFKIGDVARICEVETYVLRFWESQFPQPQAQQERHRAAALSPTRCGTGFRDQATGSCRGIHISRRAPDSRACASPPRTRGQPAVGAGRPGQANGFGGLSYWPRPRRAPRDYGTPYRFVSADPAPSYTPGHVLSANGLSVSILADKVRPSFYPDETSSHLGLCLSLP